MAFAHWDLEGSENRVLDGARATLARDRPVFTIEMFPHTKKNGAPARELLQAVASMGYDSFMVDEPCGIPLDCRNVVCVPRERRQAFERSAHVAAGTKEGWLVEVDAKTVQSFGFPCCARGGGCCLPKSSWWTCCQPTQLYEWSAQHAMMRDRLPSQALFKFWNVPGKLMPAKELMARRKAVNNSIL